MNRNGISGRCVLEMIVRIMVLAITPFFQQQHTDQQYCKLELRSYQRYVILYNI